MKFGEVPSGQACGAILAHSLKLEGRAFKKGRRLGEEDVRALLAAGHQRVVVARLEPDDLGEDEAAARLAAALAGPGVEIGAPFTGRVNLFAAWPGLLDLDTARLEAMNAVDESLTVATLDAEHVVVRRQLVATVKVIPFAVPRMRVEAAETAVGDAAVRVCAWVGVRACLVQTRLPGTREAVLDKTRRVLDARLEALGGHIECEVRCEHAEASAAAALDGVLGSRPDLVLVAGASAIVDRRDVVPASIERAGGRVEQFGMPVDPGNLLLLGALGEATVIGLPGCARSPKFNGFDQVLQRIAVGLEVDASRIKSMGVGGLLKEIAERPQPRRGSQRAAARAPARAPRIAAIVLAAGQSRRMGAANKLLLDIDGRAMVAGVVDEVSRAPVEAVYVVTGHEHERVAEALGRRDVRLVANPGFASGIAGSLRRGLEALPADIEGAVICLGDMPDVRAEHVGRLIAAFDPIEGREICVPVHGGRRGNPVLWGRHFFPEMCEVQGDVGARHLIGEHAERVCEVPVDDGAVLVDLDTEEALREWSAARGTGTSGAPSPGRGRA